MRVVGLARDVCMFWLHPDVLVSLYQTQRGCLLLGGGPHTLPTIMGLISPPCVAATQSVKEASRHVLVPNIPDNLDSILKTSLKTKTAMLSFLRGTSPPRTNNAANNPILYENGRSSVTFRKPGSDYLMTHVIPPADNKDDGGVSIITPPFHYHLHQDEYFRVQKGTGHFYLGVDPTPFAVLSSSSDINKRTTTTTTTIPRGRYHRFENASPAEDLVVDIHLAPEAYEAEQRFFRNFFGYLDDCKRARATPSVFQLFVFLESADTPLAVPLPWEGLGKVVSRILLTTVAFWGKWVLGYRDSYAEYYEEGKSK